MASHLELLNDVLEDLGSVELKRFQWFLKQASSTADFTGIPKCKLEEADRQDTVDLMVQTYGLPGALQRTEEILKKINRNDLVEQLIQRSSESSGAAEESETSENTRAPPVQPPCSSAAGTEDLLVQQPKPPKHIQSYQRKLQSNLQDKYMCTPEGSSKQKDKKLLDEIYTELFIIEGNDVDVNRLHEARLIETASRKLGGMERSIQHNDIFKHPSGEITPVRAVLTNGIAGIGKTFLVNKFILDWAEGRANQDAHLIFPFTFRQLNLLSGRRFLFAELIHKCITESRDIKEEALNFIFSELQASGNTNYDKATFKVLFVLDGLDESRLKLDFRDSKECSLHEPLFVNDLLANLIKGKLLPSARLWITTRPAAASQIPPELMDIVTEVRGFTDSQKEHYFRQRFTDPEQASRIISHIKRSQSLHIMCHIPVFCWITTSVLKQTFVEDEKEEVPETLTEMYIRFLVFQIKQAAQKYDQDKNLEVIHSLSKLAFKQLETGNLIFYEKDLRESGICPHEASVYSGVFTQIFKEEDGLNEDKMFSFVHMSIHEFLAAVFVALSVFNDRKNVMAKPKTLPQHLRVRLRKASATEVCREAVNQALQSPNGHLDLFLRFLLGLTLKSNQDLLKGLLKQPKGTAETPQTLIRYTKTKITENPSPERSINLFHCLSELKDSTLVEEVKKYLRSRSVSTARLSPAHWSALVYVLLSSNQDLDVFDLKKYSRSEEVLLRILPLVQVSTTALLSHCGLSTRSCDALASVLRTQSCSLKKLDLSLNNLQDAGVDLLCAGLRSPHCTLEDLRSSGACCHNVGQFSSLTDLDLCNNSLGDFGLLILYRGMASPHCRLETLRLGVCGLTYRGCKYLGQWLSSESCTLKNLDLSNNDLQSSGVQLLAEGLESPHCGLETLELSGCLITEDGFAALASALSVNPSHLKVLDLSYNSPGDVASTLLSVGLEDPRWRLENIRLDHCGETKISPGLQKYACELKLDPSTANRSFMLSEDHQQVTMVRMEQPYPDHPERFEYRYQVLCRTGLTGRCYWEVEWKGQVSVGVTYRGISRKGRRDDSLLGWNDKSWSLDCNNNTAWHCGSDLEAPEVPQPSPSSRVAVYLDWPAGTLSFYKVSSNTQTHLHTFYCTFTEPLYPAFRVLGTYSFARLL